MKSEALINTSIVIFVVVVVVIVVVVLIRSYIIKCKNRKQQVQNAHGQENVEMVKKAD
jgi:flagellar biosynthesis/type III secretory pathway M-ring protein FliF/YscJ